MCMKQCLVDLSVNKTLLDFSQYFEIYIYTSMLIERTPPPPGGVPIYYVPWSRTVCKRFYDKMRPSHLVVKSLTHGSWSGNIVNRKPPRGGGFFRSMCIRQCLVDLSQYFEIYIYICMCIRQCLVTWVSTSHFLTWVSILQSQEDSVWPISLHCSALQLTATHRNTLQLTATHCNTLQRTATHCNTPQHTMFQ